MQTVESGQMNSQCLLSSFTQIGTEMKLSLNTNIKEQFHKTTRVVNKNVMQLYFLSSHTRLRAKSFNRLKRSGHLFACSLTTSQISVCVVV